jgi:hypothetical protein
MAVYIPRIPVPTIDISQIPRHILPRKDRQSEREMQIQLELPAEMPQMPEFPDVPESEDSCVIIIEL